MRTFCDRCSFTANQKKIQVCSRRETPGVCKCRIGIMFCLTIQRAKKRVGGKSILVIVLVALVLCGVGQYS